MWTLRNTGQNCNVAYGYKNVGERKEERLRKIWIQQVAELGRKKGTS